MAPTSVPQDIIETIIDELQDDLRTLTTCTLVSHTFRPQSQKHIFSRIALLVYRNRRIQQINDILSIHPELALYVRHLRISLGRTPDHTLARTVRMLTQIRSLHFGWLGSSVGWEKYSVDVKSAILDLFYLPSLAKISISKFKLFPCISALGNSYQLRTLELFDAFPPVEDINDQSDPTALDNSQLVEKDMRLDSLRLEFSFFFHFSAETSAHTALLRILIKPYVFPGIARLRKLDVGWLTTPEEVKLCQKLLEVTTDSLQDLTLRLGRPRAYVHSFWYSWHDSFKI